jgi:demethylmenaquinone methyltransferase/2-methoxy-6-polyprenyl-1,4-benzoquinol methylase
MLSRETSDGEHRKAQYVRRVFDTIAGGYDLVNLLMTGGLLKYWHRVFRSVNGLSEGDQALDVACGTGDLALIMASQVEAAGRVVGLDFSPEMLKIAEKKVSRSGLDSTVELVEGNALDLPFDDNSFDCAAIGFALRNVADLERALAEMTRVVRPGGSVVSLELTKPRSGLVSKPFWWYITRVVPFVGRLFGSTGDEELALAPYAWLSTSVRAFFDSEALAERFRAAGLTDVEVVGFHGGTVSIHVGTKCQNATCGS